MSHFLIFAIFFIVASVMILANIHHGFLKNRMSLGIYIISFALLGIAGEHLVVSLSSAPVYRNLTNDKFVKNVNKCSTSEGKSCSLRDLTIKR